MTLVAVRRRAHQWLCLVVLLLFAGASGGCLAAAAAGAGVGAKFATGNAKGIVQASPEEVAQAAREVLRDNNFTIVEDRVTGSGDIEIEGALPSDRKARLNIEGFGDATELSVRLGLLGDKDESRFYFDKIKQAAE